MQAECSLPGSRSQRAPCSARLLSRSPGEDMISADEFILLINSPAQQSEMFHAENADLNYKEGTAA